MHRIRVGTSGWQYQHWRRVLYPDGLPQRAWLQRYAQVFDTVELNNTFYRLPTERAVEGWKERAPPGFLFACKGSRYLTHMKRLLDAGPGIDRYFSLALRLGERLGPVLWQLPPQMVRADPSRLDAFLARLPKGVRHAVEFRSADWYCEEICEVLEQHGAAFCEHDLVPLAPPRATGGFRYLRFHGAAGKYRGRYGKAALEAVARDLQKFANASGDAFVYFNNDLGGHAVRDALELLELLDERAAERPLRAQVLAE